MTGHGAPPLQSVGADAGAEISEPVTDQRSCRNGAILKGYVYDKDGTPWLRAERIRQAGSTEWKDLGQGKWMAFDGGPYNGGQWLHETAETDA